MTKRGLNVAIFLHNFSGFLNHNYKNNKFSVSKVKMLVNSALLIFSLIIIYIYSTDKRLNEHVFRSATKQFKELSTFFKVSTITAVSLLHLSGTLINLSTKILAGRMEFFLNQALSLKLSNTHFRNFKTKCLRQTVVICCLQWIANFFKFLAITKFGFSYFLIYLVFLYPTCIALSFATFIKGFELFLIELMTELENAIKLNNKNKKKNFGQIVLARHEQIHRLAENFNGMFGNHLTMITCTITLLTVLYVSFSLNFEEKSNLLFV